MWVPGMVCSLLTPSYQPVCPTLVPEGWPWTHFYVCSLIVYKANTTLNVYAFRPTVKELSIEWKMAPENAQNVILCVIPSQMCPCYSSTLSPVHCTRLFAIFRILYKAS